MTIDEHKNKVRELHARMLEFRAKEQEAWITWADALRDMQRALDEQGK